MMSFCDKTTDRAPGEDALDTCILYTLEIEGAERKGDSLLT